MGRLMDKDELIKYVYDTYGIGSGQATNKECFDIICHIYEAPTVEAIPKDQYEARLKADLVAMLEEISLEIEEKTKDPALDDYDCGFNTGVYVSRDIIQQKINSLKED